MRISRLRLQLAGSFALVFLAGLGAADFALFSYLRRGAKRDFNAQPKPGTRTFLHIGAANYRSHVWVNAKRVCDHFTNVTIVIDDENGLHGGRIAASRRPGPACLWLPSV